MIQTLNKPDIYAQEDDPLKEWRNYTLIENDIRKDETSLAIEKSENDVKSTVLLLLDLSGSIKEGFMQTLQTETNSFIQSNTINDIAIYYFNSKKNIIPLDSETTYPTKDIVKLQKATDKLTDLSFIENELSGFDATNLYGAIEQSGEKVCSWMSDCTDKNSFEIGSIILITDGRDTADIVEFSEMTDSLKETKNLFYYALGIGDTANKTLEKIESQKDYYFKFFEGHEDSAQDDLKGIFDYVLNNSNFYTIKYCPATQTGTVKIEIEFDDGQFKAQTQKDTITLDNKIDLRCDL